MVTYKAAARQRVSFLRSKRGYLSHSERKRWALKLDFFFASTRVLYDSNIWYLVREIAHYYKNRSMLAETRTGKPWLLTTVLYHKVHLECDYTYTY
jgi:hypothetical protein